MEHDEEIAVHSSFWVVESTTFFTLKSVTGGNFVVVKSFATSAFVILFFLQYS